MQQIKLALILGLCLTGLGLAGQERSLPEIENDYYRIVTLPTPEGMLLEVGGLTTLDDGRIALCTRRGDVWIVENPEMYGNQPPRYSLFANGLHEPLGLAFRNRALYVAQRGELTRLRDTDGDGRANRYETVFDWPLSGHYHEYSYGPKFLPDGSMMVTGNVAFGDQEWWRGESRVPWRGWAMRIWDDGRMEPWATGMRSPAGLGIIDGEFFYADNQGDWIGSGGIWHVPKGAFTGHPAGLEWTAQENAPLDLSPEAFYAKIDKRQVMENGRYVKPNNIRNEEDPDIFYDLKSEFPEFQPPAVWLPHGILGISNSEIVTDSTAGAFGPFTGQLFVGDQGQSKIMRVALEQVEGAYQGVAFDFRAGFQSGVLRMTWGHDGSLYVGETNRGWGSAGNTDSGLERLVWTGRMPFEMKTVRAMPDGFEIEFTLPVDSASATKLESYSGQSFIYKYHPVYGSPPIHQDSLDIQGIQLSEDRRKVRLVVGNLRRYYIHQLSVAGLRSAQGQLPVLHPNAYYTLNQIPAGEGLPEAEWTVNRRLVLEARAKAAEQAKRAKATAAPRQAEPAPEARLVSARAAEDDLSYETIEPLLVKNTCIACHRVDQRQVGPAFQDVAKRGYTPERIVELIYNPEPENWPDYAVPMAAMPQVPKEEALQIARWINSLR